MLRASVDLGTNTCLLLVAEWDEVKGEVKKIVFDTTSIVRLGERVDVTKLLSEVAIERTLKTLKAYADKLRSFALDPGKAICVATSQARDAENGAEFFTRVEKETGLKFEILSGKDEAHYTFLGGILPGMQTSKTAVIDIGGGSTEFMAESGGLSLDMGSVRFTERYLKTKPGTPISDQQFWDCQEAIDQMLEKVKTWRNRLPNDTQLLAVAGTATTLAAYHLSLVRYDASLIDQVVLTRGDLHRMVEELKWRTAEERRQLPGMEQGREDVILAGTLILWRSMELLGFQNCRVSSRGLRFGVLNMA